MSVASTTGRSNPDEPSALAAGIQRVGGFPLWTALLIVAGTLYLAFTDGLLGLDQVRNQLLPFVATLVGVSLYMMSATKSYKERFTYRYLPDYCYRIAQSVVYTYVVLAIMNQTDVGLRRPPPAPQTTSSPSAPPATSSISESSTGTTSAPATPGEAALPTPIAATGRDRKEPSTAKDFASWPPNLIGLLIGMFILHVEKAMEGFGERFGEALIALLGRSLEGKTPREKQMDRIRDEKKLEEIRQQAELIASQAPGRAVIQGFQKRIADVTITVRDGEPDAIHDDVVKLAWEFEQLKVALREETTTVAEILGRPKPRARLGPDKE